MFQLLETKFLTVQKFYARMSTLSEIRYIQTRAASKWKHFLKLTFEENNGAEGHDDHADEEVGHGEGHQEVVGHVLQLPVLHDHAKLECMLKKI